MIKFKADYERLIKQRDWRSLKQTLNDSDPIEVAQIMEDVSRSNRIIVFGLLNQDQATAVFKFLDHDIQEQVIEDMAHNIRHISRLLNNINPDDRTAFFKELPGKVTQQLIGHLSPEERLITTRLLGYPEDSIGRLMTPEFVAVRPEYTIEHAFAHIRKHGRDSETVNVIYIIDENDKLIDDVKISQLILASPEQNIKDLMDYRFVSLNAMDDQEAAIKVFRDYDRVALPVVNQNGILLGIVTFDDIMDVVEEESTEDFHKFGSFQEAVANPLKERILILYRNRIVWLILLVFMNVFSGAALMSFESVIESVVSLVFFLPLLIDSGGNAGSQSATLMIRALAVGDVKLSDWYKLMGKELVVSLFLGITMAMGIALIASFRAPEVIVVVVITMILTVMTGSVVGLLLPFIFTRLGLDPATASAPLITSIADICGVIIYFSIATWYFGG